MGSPLPGLSRQEFSVRLETALGASLGDSVLGRLFDHYQEMRRWNPRLSLVGPGTADQVVERHYAESLAALPEFDGPTGRLVDLGSGGGFPGWVLAAALPEWQVTLVEPNNRKRAFLLAAARRADFSLSVLDARVESVLPASFPEAIDRVTVRALKLSPGALAAVVERMSPTGRLLLWTGAERVSTPTGWTLSRHLALPGRTRRIAVLERAGATMAGGTER